MVPRLGRFQGLKVPRLEGGRVGELQTRRAQGLLETLPGLEVFRVGSFQGWTVGKLLVGSRVGVGVPRLEYVGMFQDFQG